VLETRNRATWIPWLALVIAAAGIPLAARTPTSALMVQDEVQATHDELRALKKGAEEAFNRLGMSGNREDLDRLLAFVADDIVLVPMNGQTAVGKQGIIDYFMRTMTGPNRTVQSVYHEFEVAQLATLYGGDTAVSFGTTRGRYELTGGMRFDVTANWSATLVKQNGTWVLASFQFAPSIFDNPILNQTVRTMYWAVAIASLVTLLVGFVLGRWMGRRRTTGHSLDGAR
jgi:ketosteroid isomerase-like protein